MSGDQGIEYTVLGYLHQKDIKDGEDSVEVLMKTANMDEAMQEAEDYLDGGDYAKMEVKKKFFDEKNNREVDMVLKVLEGKNKKETSVWVFAAMAVVAGLAAFGLAFFLGGGMNPKT